MADAGTSEVGGLFSAGTDDVRVNLEVSQF